MMTNIYKQHNLLYFMVKQIRIFRRARNSGGSLIFSIGKDAVKMFNIKTDDLIELIILNNHKKQSKSYKCTMCEHYFDSDDDMPYCPICGKEDNIIEVNI